MKAQDCDDIGHMTWKFTQIRELEENITNAENVIFGEMQQFQITVYNWKQDLMSICIILLHIFSTRSYMVINYNWPRQSLQLRISLNDSILFCIQQYTIWWVILLLYLTIFEPVTSLLIVYYEKVSFIIKSKKCKALRYYE